MIQAEGKWSLDIKLNPTPEYRILQKKLFEKEKMPDALSVDAEEATGAASSVASPTVEF